MNHLNHLLGQLNDISIQMSSTAMDMGQNDSSISASNGMQSGGISQAEAIIFGSKLQGQVMGLGPRENMPDPGLQEFKHRENDPKLHG